jgi:hypothetical protein
MGELSSVMAAAQAAAPSSAAASLGAAVLMLMLGAGIFVGIRSKKLTWTELIICGGFGLLLGTTAVGSSLSGPLGSLGSGLLSLVS